MTLFSILRNAGRKSKSKMAAYKPEIITSQPVYNVAAQFQPQYHCFSKAKNSMKLFLHCVMQTIVRNPRWRLAFCIQLASHMIKTGFFEFLDFENMGIVVGIAQLYCIPAEII